jgi:superfamily II DNA or RNA helicase
MTFTLRPFQQKLIDEVIESAKKHQNIALIAMTGAGKTVIASAILKRFNDTNRKAIFFVDRKDLTSQTIKKLGDMKFGVIASGYPEPKYEDYNIFIAMIQTFEDRPYWHDKFFHLMMFDEGHESCWRKLSLELIEKTTKWVIALTATPYRLSKRQFFGDIFTDAIIAPSFAELQSLGYLAKLEYYPVSHADFSQVKVVRGEYAENEISKLVNTDNTIRRCLQDGYVKYGQNKRAVAFGASVEHAKAILRIAMSISISAELVTGETKKREEIYERCEKGITQMLITCDALSKGWDLPCIKCVILMAPSLSPAKILQRVGRGARPYNNETCIVFDCVGCLDNLPALPCEIVHTKESVLSRKPLKEIGEAPVKICPDCNRIIGAYHRVCPYCAYNFPIKEKEVVEIDRSFNRLITTKEVREVNTEEVHKEYYRQLLRSEYASSRCTTGAYTKYVQKKFELFPKPKSEWGIGAIFNRDRDKFETFRKTVTSGAYLRFKGNPPSWVIANMIKTEWGS